MTQDSGLRFNGIVIKGKVSPSEPRFKYKLDKAIILNAKEKYVTYLSSFLGWQNVPNILNGENDNFTYDNPSQISKTFIFEQGGYSISKISSYIDKFIIEKGDQTLDQKHITFTLVDETLKIRMFVDTGFRVDFTPSNSVGAILGFNNQVYLAGTYESTKVIQIQKTSYIQIYCSIAWGCIDQSGKIGNVLYNIPNTIPNGFRIKVEPNPIFEVDMEINLITEIYVWFKDDNGKYLYLNEEDFALTLVIKKL